MNPSLALVFVGLCFGGICAGINWVESKAATCDRHSRVAGKMAQILALLCGMVAIALFVGAFLLARQEGIS